MAKAELYYCGAGGPIMNTTREQAPTIMTKLVMLGVEFRTSHLDNIGYPDKMQIVLMGGTVNGEKAVAALREGGLLETEPEREERLVLNLKPAK